MHLKQALEPYVEALNEAYLEQAGDSIPDRVRARLIMKEAARGGAFNPVNWAWPGKTVRGVTGSRPGRAVGEFFNPQMDAAAKKALDDEFLDIMKRIDTSTLDEATKKDLLSQYQAAAEASRTPKMVKKTVREAEGATADARVQDLIDAGMSRDDATNIVMDLSSVSKRQRDLASAAARKGGRRQGAAAAVGSGGLAYGSVKGGNALFGGDEVKSTAPMTDADADGKPETPVDIAPYLYGVGGGFAGGAGLRALYNKLTGQRAGKNVVGSGLAGAVLTPAVIAIVRSLQKGKTGETKPTETATV